MPARRPLSHHAVEVLENARAQRRLILPHTQGMQPQIAALLSIAQGTSILNESVWENRFRYVEELDTQMVLPLKYLLYQLKPYHQILL